MHRLVSFENNRIVHLDLKGAPYKVPYLEKVILVAKRWGATGILFEWEDTFPYTGDIVDIGSVGGSGGDDLYSVEEVQYLMRFTKDNGLEPIQLVQTIGHMEFVLKHPAFSSLRERPRSVAVLCPSQPDSSKLVKMMLRQVLDLQPDASYLHIGADEVWHSAVCPECKQRAETSKHGKASLFLNHIRDIAIFLKQQRPNLTILMWDDMLRSISVDTLKDYKLGELVEPVLWHYNPKECFQIEPSLWHLYRQIFTRVWGGSAFKGANGSCCIASPVSRYVSNHDAWREEIKKYNSYLHVAGIILTGWSRFDHYATLCELLPVSLPSLASCLKVIMKGDNHTNESLVSDVLQSEEWPGEELARNVCDFAVHRERCLGFINGDLITTWLNPWQLENNYVHPVQIEAIGTTANHFLLDLNALKDNIQTHLLTITGKRSTEEWISTLARPILNRLSEIKDTVENRLQMDAGVTPTGFFKRSIM